MQRASRVFQIGYQTVSRVGKLREAERKTPHFSVRDRQEHMRAWAEKLLSLLNVEVASNRLECTRPYLFVGNHISYLDIPVLMSQQPVVFVAKKQIASWPIFGTAMRCVGTIFVERESKTSRRGIGEVVAPYLLERGQSVAIFPSGTTSRYEEKPWRWGAFRIAAEYGIPVVPFRLTYDSLNEVAYLLEHSFPTHLWKLMGRRRIRASVEFHRPVMVENAETEAERWRRWTHQAISEWRRQVT